MAIVIKVCNTIRNFLYPHMVAIRGFSISNFIWYSSSGCIRRSQIACCVPVWVKGAVHHTTKPDGLHGLCMHAALWTVVPRPGARLGTHGKSLASPLPRFLFLADTSLCHSLSVCHRLSPTVCHLDVFFHRNYLFYSPFLPSAPSNGLCSSLLSSNFFSWSWKLCVPFDEENGYIATVSITCFPFSIFLLYAAGVNVIMKTLQSFSLRH